MSNRRRNSRNLARDGKASRTAGANRKYRFEPPNHLQLALLAAPPLNRGLSIHHPSHQRQWLARTRFPVRLSPSPRMGPIAEPHHQLQRHLDFHVEPRLSDVLDLPAPRHLPVSLSPAYPPDPELSSRGLLPPGDRQKAVSNGFVPDTTVPLVLLRIQLPAILSRRKNSVSLLEMIGNLILTHHRTSN